MKTNKKIIVALDNNNLARTIKLVRKINKEVFAFKIGYEFFFNFGVEGYEKIYKICPKIFLDLKLHDIPNTVDKGMQALRKLKPTFTTIHISGGDDMMRAAVTKNKKTKVIGVSVLTSFNNKMAKKYYNNENIKLIVKKFVKQAKINKLDGIVCSPQEIELVRKELGNKYLIITPGIRLERSKLKSDDQKRVLTPKRAISLGANLLVIGRPITNAEDPLDVIKKINKSLN